MTVYMEVTRDKYELPIAVANTVYELANMTNTSVNAIRSNICHAKKKGYKCKYVKVEVEECD